MQQRDQETRRLDDPLTERIIGACIAVHRSLGPGLLESAYEQCLCHELSSRNIQFRRQVPIPIDYKGTQLECGYRVDLLIEDSVLLEIKSVEQVLPVHLAQVITYLKLGGYPTGLLINFNVTSLRQGIRRLTQNLLSS